MRLRPHGGLAEVSGWPESTSFIGAVSKTYATDPKYMAIAGQSNVVRAIATAREEGTTSQSPRNARIYL